MSCSWNPHRQVQARGVLQAAQASVPQVIELERRCVAWALARGNIRVDDDEIDTYTAAREAGDDILSWSEQMTQWEVEWRAQVMFDHLGMASWTPEDWREELHFYEQELRDQVEAAMRTWWADGVTPYDGVDPSRSRLALWRRLTGLTYVTSEVDDMSIDGAFDLEF